MIEKPEQIKQLCASNISSVNAADARVLETECDTTKLFVLREL